MIEVTVILRLSDCHEEKMLFSTIESIRKIGKCVIKRNIPEIEFDADGSIFFFSGIIADCCRGKERSAFPASDSGASIQNQKQISSHKYAILDVDSTLRVLEFISDEERRMMAQFFCRMWDRAQGKLYVVRICDKVFTELSDKNTQLLDISSLHVATLMVYNSINKQLAGPHKDPPCMNVVAKQMEQYKKETPEGITLEEFRRLIMEWVRKDLRLVLANKAAVAIMAAPLLAVTTKSAGRQVPRVGPAVEKVPTPLLFTVFSVGLMFLQDIRAGKQ
ncbi:hypothetical protein OsI_17262 [Oryza sativa Indica Group]|uniref:Uncharacterized protein n=1 Tax=Oryza sativa subsp. indica TaxID=39946 RepID=B8ATN1_ORYSI|nr:hypothetical protein OsI_17262 [Oryza sativa Indica Group]